jgi:hypothetical protein
VLLVDANVLLHAVNEGSIEHDAADSWLRQALVGSEPVAFSWNVVLAFLRLTTHPAIFPRPLSVTTAVGVLEAWLAAPAVLMVEPTRRHVALLAGLLEHAGTGGNLVSDAHLAALALEHGATVVSFDRDFARFDGLPLRRPG